MLKQLAKVKGAEEWQATLNETVSSATDCLNRLSQAGDEGKREVMDDCWGLRLWDNLNEIREQFVPPQDIQNALREIKNQTRDLNRFKKQLAKTAGAGEAVQLADNLLAQLEVYKNNINNSAGRDQREALEDYWQANVWEEVNKVRARVELPRELKNISRELNGLKKDAKVKSLQKALQFFGVDAGKLQSGIDAKQATIEQINNLVNQGNFEEAFMLLQEDVHEGWHPGDARHFLGLLREAYERLKGVRDADLKAQVMAIIAPIADSFNAGDYREARDALVQFVEQMQKYERVFRPYYRGGKREIDEKTAEALERLEALIQEKLQKESAPTLEAPPAVPAEPGPVPVEGGAG